MCTVCFLTPGPVLGALLGGLTPLSRDRLRSFRVRVGRSVADALSSSPPPPTTTMPATRTARCAADCPDQLADLGLSDKLLRQSLRVFFVVKDLPRALVAQLVYSHIVRLTAIEDDQTRALLAKATVDNHWSGQALQLAIEAVREGRWPDGDPDQPGLRPAAE